jgi:hypothetical protein
VELPHDDRTDYQEGTTMLLKDNPEALKAYRETKTKALAKTATARKAADRRKAAHNAGVAVAPKKT